MYRILAAVGFVAAFVAPALRGQPPADAERLMGHWEVVKAERDEAPAKELLGARFQFDGRKMTITPAEPPAGKAKLPQRLAVYHVVGPDGPNRPPRVRFTPEDGPNKGQELEGVFRFDGEKLELCHCGVPRTMKGLVPTDFATRKGSGIVWMTMKRLP